MFHVFFLVILLCVCVLVVASSILPPKIGHLLQRTNVIVDDELKYYKLGMDKYRDRIHRKTADSLRDFSLKQRESFINIKKQMVLGIKAYKEICDHADKRMKENQLKLKALNQKFKQRDLFDDSLDSFRAFYSHGGVSGGQNNIRRWASIQTARCRRSIESAMRLVGMRGQTNRNENVDRLLNELKSFHNTMQQRVAVLNSTIHAAFPAAVCKEDVRRAREAVDAQLHRLEQEGALWLDSTRRQVDSSVRALQARLQQRTRVLATLESEVRQKAVAVEYSTLNDQALHQVLQMIDPKSEGKFYFALLCRY